MEVVVGKDEARLVGGDALDVVRPAAGELACSLPSLNTSVHGKNTFVAKVAGDELSKVTQSVVVEGARSQRELLGLSK